MGPVMDDILPKIVSKIVSDMNSQMTNAGEQGQKLEEVKKLISDLEQKRCKVLAEALERLETFHQRILSLEKSSEYSTLDIQEDVRLESPDLDSPIKPCLISLRFLCFQDSSRSPRLNNSIYQTLLKSPNYWLNFQPNSYRGRDGNEDNAYGCSVWGGIAWDDEEREESNRENQYQLDSFHQWLEFLPNNVDDYFRLNITPDTQQVGLESPPRYQKPSKKYRCAVMGVACPYYIEGKNYLELRYILPSILKHQLCSIGLIGKMPLVIYVYCTVVDVERVLGNHMP